MDKQEISQQKKYEIYEVKPKLTISNGFNFGLGFGLGFFISGIIVLIITIISLTIIFKPAVTSFQKSFSDPFGVKNYNRIF